MKTELLQQISDRLNAKGFTEHSSKDLLSSDRQPFAVGRGLMKQFQWLPEENLKKIAEFDISACKDYTDVYQTWGRKGFFKFVPYIVDGKDNPTLVLKHNKFMHMFRGYHFQISGTKDGIGECNIGNFRTSGLLRLLANYEHYEDSHLLFLMMYSAMIDCGFQNDNFRYAFYDHTDVIDKFFAASMKYWRVNFPYDSSLLQQYISYEDATLDSLENTETTYEICVHGEPVCRFYMLQDEICVEYNPTIELTQSRLVRFSIPDACVGIAQDALTRMGDEGIDDMYGEIKDSISKYETIEQWILVMVLKLVGIHTCFMATYPIKRIGVIPFAKETDCKLFEDLNWKESKDE